MPFKYSKFLKFVLVSNFWIFKMLVLENGQIEVTEEDISKWMTMTFYSKEERPHKFLRHANRDGVKENGGIIRLVDHHIVSRQDIKIWLLKLKREKKPIPELKKMVEKYLNDSRNADLREIIKYEHAKNTAGYHIIYLSIMFNPNNLVYGPPYNMRTADPGFRTDLELLAFVDLGLKKQLTSPMLSILEKISMLANNEKRGVTTWICDPSRRNLYFFEEDLNRIGKNVCHWYEDGYDKLETPKKCIKLLDGTLVDCKRSLYMKMITPIQKLFSSIKNQKFFS